MIQFTKPENLNGAELLAELKAGGVTISEWPMVENDNFWLDIAETDKAKATPIVVAHNGTIIPTEPTIADKLASVGLSVTDLKEALGL
jgi:hypothetical protein